MGTAGRALGWVLIWLLGLEVVLRLLLLGAGVHWPRFGVSTSPHYTPLPMLRMTGPSFESILVHHPVLGWTNRPRRALDNDQLTTVDERGFRVIGGPSADQASRVVAVVGDSFSFGTDLADADVMLAHVQAGLPSVALENLGVPIYGPDQMWLAYRELGRALEPDLVVMALLGVDLFRAEHDFLAFPKPQFVLRGEALELRGVPTLDREAVRWVSVVRPRSYDAIRMLWEALYVPIPAPGTDEHALHAAIVQGFIDEVRADGSDVLVLGLPDGNASDDAVPWFDAVCRDPEACVAVDVDFETLRADGVDPLGPYHHWSPAGSRRVAEAILDQVGATLRGEVPPGVETEAAP